MQFRVRPLEDGVYEIQEVESGEVFKLNVNTMQATKPLDELTLAAVMQALTEYGIVEQQNGSYGATERGAESGNPERIPQLNGIDAWNAQFNSYSPSGFRASGNFGTAGVGSGGTPGWVSSVGGSWGSSPSGWNRGGWSPDPGPSQLWQLMNQGYSRDDAFRVMGGVQPLAALQNQVQETENLINQNAQQSTPEPIPNVSQRNREKFGFNAKDMLQASMYK